MKAAWSVVLLTLTASPAMAREPLVRCTYVTQYRGESRMYAGSPHPEAKALADLARDKEQFPRLSMFGKRYMLRDSKDRWRWIGPSNDLASWCVRLDDSEKIWHLLTVSRAGTVSIQHELTEQQCERLAIDLNPYRDVCNGCIVYSNPGDLERRECFK